MYYELYKATIVVKCNQWRSYEFFLGRLYNLIGKNNS